MLLCTGCGADNQEASKFCQNCGCSLEVQSSLVRVRKLGEGNQKFAAIQGKEERLRRAKALALKLSREQESQQRTATESVYIGEKIA